MIENNETEFKREFTDKIARTIVAFANTIGGSLYIGVDDDGTVVGIDDIDKVQLNVKMFCEMPFVQMCRCIRQ